MNSKNSIPKVSINQVKAARALLGWSQEDLAVRSTVSVPTIKRLEAEAARMAEIEGFSELGGRPETYEKLIGALCEGGVEFLPPEHHHGAGVRLDQSHDLVLSSIADDREPRALTIQPKKRKYRFFK